MKILFVIPSLLRAGAERMVVNTCNELVKDASNSVAIFLLENENEYSAELDDRIKVSGGGISFHLSLYKRNRIENASYINFVNEFKPDVIHSHLYLADLLTHSIHFTNTLYISHLHNSKIENYDGLNVKKLLSKRMWTDLYEYRWLLKRYKQFNTNFVACSAGAHMLHEEKIRVGQVLTLPNAIPLPEIDLSSKKINDALQLIWIGRFNDVKRPQMAIQIARELKKNGVSFSLKMAGVGSELGGCEALIQQLDLTDSIEILGLVENLTPIYSEADLMIHTSKFEGLPMVFIEANAYGIPIISTDCLPQNDIIIDGINGRILPSENPSDFVEAIDQITRNPELFCEMSKNAVYLSKKFGIDTYIQRLIHYYQTKGQNH